MILRIGILVGNQVLGIRRKDLAFGNLLVVERLGLNLAGVERQVHLEERRIGIGQIERTVLEQIGVLVRRDRNRDVAVRAAHHLHVEVAALLDRGGLVDDHLHLVYRLDELDDVRRTREDHRTADRVLGRHRHREHLLELVLLRLDAEAERCGREFITHLHCVHPLSRNIRNCIHGHHHATGRAERVLMLLRRKLHLHLVHVEPLEAVRRIEYEEFVPLAVFGRHLRLETSIPDLGDGSHVGVHVGDVGHLIAGIPHQMRIVRKFVVDRRPGIHILG